MVEWSSCILQVILVFKDLRPSLRTQYPGTYTAIRMVFAVTFLWFRVVTFVPRFVQCAPVLYLFIRTHPIVWCRIFYGLCLASFSTLMVLQLVWARTIVKGILDHAVVVRRNRKHTTPEGPQTISIAQLKEKKLS